MIRLGILLTLAFSAPIFAQEAAKYQIRQLIVERNRAVIEFSGPLSEGQDLIASFSDSKQCPLKVVKVKGNLANLDTSLCARADDLQVGQTLEVSLALDEAKPAEPEALTVSASSPKATVKKDEPIIEPPLDENKRDIFDLQFLPEQNKIVVALQYLILKSDLSATLDSSGKQIMDETVNSQQMNLAFSFGFTKELAASINFGYLIKSTSDTTFGPGSTLNGQESRVGALGYTDPTIGIKYRILEMDSRGAIGDLIVSYSPKSTSRTLGTNMSDGNGVRGGDLTSLAFEIGQKLPKISYDAHIGFNFFGATTAYNVDNSSRSDNSSFDQVVISLSGQFVLTDQLFVRAGLAENFFSSVTQSYPGSSGSSDLNIDAYNQRTIGVGLCGVAIPDRLLFSLGYTKDFDADLSGGQGSSSLSGRTSDSATMLTVVGQF